ncbi:MAG TPA: hypothetical protein VF306_06315 [Pirellulales bacterium]
MRRVMIMPSVLLACLLMVGNVSAAVFEGKVVSVDDDEYEIVIATKAGDKEFDVADDCQITLDGKKADLDELDEGAVVKLTTKSQKGVEIVIKIEAKSAQ